MIYLDGSGNPQVNPTTSLTDVVIEPPSDEAGIYKDEDPEKDHEENPAITMGHVQELTSRKATSRCLILSKKSSYK